MRDPFAARGPVSCQGVSLSARLAHFVLAALANFGLRAPIALASLIGIVIGGFVIPTALAIYESASVAPHGTSAVMIMTIVTLANIAVYYRIARRHLPKVELAMAAFIAPRIAVSSSFLFASRLCPAAGEHRWGRHV